MNALKKLYEALAPLTSQPDCASCELCERNVGLVYVLGDERASLESSCVPLATTSEGIAYISRPEHGWCPCYDTSTKRCQIYDNRPLCCRLYPLDLMEIDSAIWWVIHTECPIAQRFQRERKLDALAAMTVAIENAVSPEQLRNWLQQDQTSQTVEAFSSERSKVLQLREFGKQSLFCKLDQ